MLWLAAFLSRGGRALVVAITILPVLLLVVLSTPAWVVWPWLGAERRESVHLMVQQLGKWTRDVLLLTTAVSDPQSRQDALSHDVIVLAPNVDTCEADEISLGIGQHLTRSDDEVVAGPDAGANGS